jgi:hypothetical protein
MEIGLFLSSGCWGWGWVYKNQYQNEYQIINGNGLNYIHFKKIPIDI